MTATAVLSSMQRPHPNFQRERIIPITVIHDGSPRDPQPGKFAGVQDTLRLKPKNRSSLPFNDIPHGGTFPMPTMDDFMKNFNLLGNGNYITANSPILSAKGGNKFFDVVVRPKQPGQSSPQRSASPAQRPSTAPQGSSGFQQSPQPVRHQQFQSPQRQPQVPVVHVTPPSTRPQAPHYSITSTSRPITPEPEPSRENTPRLSPAPSSFTVHLGGSQPQHQTTSRGLSSLPAQEVHSPGHSSLPRQRTHSPVPSSRQQQEVYSPGSGSLPRQRTHSPVPSSRQQQEVYSPGPSTLPRERTHSPVPSSRQHQEVYSPGPSSLPRERTHSPVPSSRQHQEVYSPGPSGRSPPHRSFPARPTISSSQAPASSQFQANSSPKSSHVQRLTVGMSQPIPVVSEHKLEATPPSSVSYHSIPASPRSVTPEVQISSAIIIPDVNQNQHSYDNIDSRFSPDVPDSWVQQHQDGSSSSPVRSTGSPQVARAYWDPAIRASPPRADEKVTGILKSPRSSPKSRNRGVSFGTVTVYYI